MPLELRVCDVTKFSPLFYMGRAQALGISMLRWRQFSYRKLMELKTLPVSNGSKLKALNRLFLTLNLSLH